MGVMIQKPLRNRPSGARSAFLRSLAVLLLTLPAGLCASDDWANVSSLHAGDAITVIGRDRHEYKGSFLRASSESMAIEGASGEQSIDRATISRVVLRSKSKRLRNALIGAAIGAGIAVAIDQSLGRFLTNESHYDAGPRAAAWILPIGIFTGLGAAIPSYPVIYKAP
jgi:hypothetical protein